MSNFKPMLFSTDMVRAILDGTKTQELGRVITGVTLDHFASSS